MDRIALLVALQWRAYWRRLRQAGNLSRNNVGVLVLVAGLGLIRYVQVLPAVAVELSNGVSRRYESLLTVAFLLWMLPVLGETRRSISSRELVQFPLTILELYCVRVASVFVSPVSWIVAAYCFALFYPVSQSAHPLRGALAFLLFLLIAPFTSLIVADLLTINRARWALFSIAGTVLCGVVALYLAVGPTGFTSGLTRILPSRVVANAAVGSEGGFDFYLLVGVTGIAVFLSFWTFGAGLYQRPGRRQRRVLLLPPLEIPGKFFGLLRKDVRYASRLLDLYFAVPLVVLFNIYLATNSAPSPIAFWIVVTLLLVPCISLAFNSFGLDSPMGLDRYALLPLSSRETLVSKNLAFGLVTFLLFSTLLPLSIWRLGILNSLLGLMIWLSIEFAFMSYGNWLSVNQPFKMQSYRFAAGSPIDALMGIIVGSLPGVLAVFFLKDGVELGVLKISFIILICLGLYLLSLRLSSRALERRWELIAASLS